MKKLTVFACLTALIVSLFGLSAAADTISYWEVLNEHIGQVYSSLGDTPYYQEYYKQTGQDVQFINVSGADATTQFNLLMASGDYPDIIFQTNWDRQYPGAPAKLLEDGIAIPLNDLIAEHAPNFAKLLDEHPDWRKAITTEDGTIWCFPFIRGHKDLMVFYGPILRQDYLDQIGMEVPETIDEWYDVLTAMKGIDGVDYPLIIGFKAGRHINTGHNFIGAYNIGWDWYIGDDGKVHYGQYEPAYKDFLATWSTWYAEGLLHADFLTIDRKALDAAMLNGTSGAMVGYGGSNIGNYTQAMADKGTSFKLAGAKNPVLDKGETPWIGHIDLPFVGTGAIITTQADDPVAAVKWLDYAYGPEGHMLSNFGIEGVSYTMVEDYPGYEGEMFPKYTELITDNPDGLGMNQTLKLWMRAGYHGAFVQDRRYIVQYYRLPEQLTAWERWSDSKAAEHKFPAVTLTPEESEDFADIMSQVSTYMEEKYAAFTTGQESLENFDAYLEQLKKMGIEDAIALQQAAYDRYMAK